MKKLFLILPLAAFLMSCGGGCDNSSAEGAVDCYCDIMADMEAAEDDEARKAIDERGEKWEDEIEGHWDAGDYSEEDMEKAIEGRSDDCSK